MISNLFALPVWKSSLKNEDFKPQLLKQIIEDYQNNKDYTVPGWDSIINSSMGRKDTVDYSPLIFYVKREYEKFVGSDHLNLGYHDYDITSFWYNYYIKGSSQEIHHHINGNEGISAFSVVYYPKLNEDHPTISFWNPSQSVVYYEYEPKMKKIFNKQHSFTQLFHQMDVKEDDIIIFPSSLFHSVPSQRVDEPRVTVSLNISFT